MVVLFGSMAKAQEQGLCIPSNTVGTEEQCKAKGEKWISKTYIKSQITCDYGEAAKKNPVPENKCPQNSDQNEGLVKCGRKISCEYLITTNKFGGCVIHDGISKDETGKVIPEKIIRTAEMCKFSDMLALVNSLIKYILFLAVPIAAIMFVYAGILLVFSGGDPGAKTKAKSIFLNALIGLALVVGAVLIVTTILSIVGYKDSSLFF